MHVAFYDGVQTHLMPRVTAAPDADVIVNVAGRGALESSRVLFLPPLIFHFTLSGASNDATTAVKSARLLTCVAVAPQTDVLAVLPAATVTASVFACCHCHRHRRHLPCHSWCPCMEAATEDHFTR